MATRERQRDRERDKETQRDRETERDRETQRDTETESGGVAGGCCIKAFSRVLLSEKKELSLFCSFEVFVPRKITFVGILLFGSFSCILRNLIS